MTRINLLPWREWRKKEQQREFTGILVFVVFLAGAVWYGGVMYFNDHISGQENRNDTLRAEIERLDREIEEIERLDTVREQLLGRMRVIEELQAGRPQIVHTFEELATTVPDGVYLNSADQSGSRITIAGHAESNARVSSYMERLDASDWLRDPDLEVIERESHDGTRVSRFRLRVDQTDPHRDSDNGGSTE